MVQYVTSTVQFSVHVMITFEHCIGMHKVQNITRDTFFIFLFSREVNPLYCTKGLFICYYELVAFLFSMMVIASQS